MAGGEFVEGWLVAQVLGEGAYGEVRLLVHARTGARVALKAVRRGAGGETAREAALHVALRHRHVLRCLGAREHLHHHYLFLEYAAGGELFERIVPDAGMAAGAARRYWRQLAAGLRYLHARGVAHRDLKPENLLLDHHDDIKISDFGMATVFRHGSRERLLSRVCGTLPYAAPEVHDAPARPYRAPPADVWAAAVVLVAMLAGELPWERASEQDERYAAWSAWCGGRGRGRGEPPPGALWARLPAPALRWVRRALQPAPGARAPLADLLLDTWMQDAPRTAAAEGRGCMSQPARGVAGVMGVAGVGEGEAVGVGSLRAADMDALISCSQPACADDLLLSSPLDTHAHAHAPLWECEEVSAADGGGGGGGAARRLARVWVAGGVGAALRAVCAAAGGAGCGARLLDARSVALDAGGGGGLRMRAWAVAVHTAPAASATLVQFRRWRGCGLQFQRKFLELRAALAPHIAPTPAPAPAPSPAPAPMDE